MIFLKGLEGIGSLTYDSFKLIDMANFWENNVFIFRLKYGGLFSNTIMLCLATLGVYILKKKEYFHDFLYSLLLTSSFFYFISYEEIISRLLYNLPLGVFAAIGLLSMSKKQIRNI